MDLDDLKYESFGGFNAFKCCDRIESDNKNLCITHRKLKPLILMIWIFFHRIIFLKNRFGYFFSCEICDATLSQFVLESVVIACRPSFLSVRHFKQFYHHLHCPSF
jgi:hypothetical protein